MDIYVVDTSAFFRDANLLDNLSCCEIVIHTTVLEELDNIGRKNSTRGAYARHIGNRLFEMQNRGDFLKGIKVDHKLIRFEDLRPDTNTYLRFGFDPDKNDNLLLCVARELREKTDRRVILLTGDKFFLLKAAMDLEVKYIKSPRQKKMEKYKKYNNNCRKAM